MKLVSTNSLNRDFQILCNQLDNELNKRYGKSQSKYNKHNIIEDTQTVMVGYLNGNPVASGCFKVLDKETVEIKRMYVKAQFRRKGLSISLLNSLEKWAKELGFSVALVETGKGQPEAISLYKKNGYEILDNYGPYTGIENSLCMKKKI